MGALDASFNVHKVEAYPDIAIMADGSIYPSTANITSSNNVTYSFTADINAYLVVERDDIVVDGAGYTVQGGGYGTGIDLSDRNNVTLKNVEVTNFGYGIYLLNSSHNTIVGNTVSNNIYNAILLESSSDNVVSGNNASNNWNGIYLSGSSNNVVSGNNASNNTNLGIYLHSSSNNVLFHNNLVGNAVQATVTTGYANTWDDGVEGNYWSNYTGVDLNHDGIGDTSHVIDANNTDYYPLMGMFSDFEATLEHHVQTICNSTVSDFQFDGTSIRFNVSGEDGTTGFCRILVPTALVNEPYTVLVNATEVSYNLLPLSNETQSYLYFTYSHSTQQVIIIPEFPSFLILPLLIIATLVTVFYAKKRKKT